ncbi:M20/M25/M40 family metallo-hydrolase [Rheinheimera sp.]|uniref:M20/M25/M40 family metallo-hydrolase n=1 Tax=Rheinheimera sp. TaxID=1869214 RepID=UPI00307DD7F3
MKIRSLLFGLSLSAIFPVFAATTVLNQDLAYQLVESLTTEIGPRIAGSEADRRAADWAVRHFKALGYDKVWTEAFEMPGWTRGQASLEVVSPFPQPLVLTSLGGSIGTPAHGISAEVVMFDSIEALQQANKSQVQGKIVFINKPMLKDKSGSFYGQVVAARARGAVEAAKLGAQAILIRSVGTSNNRFAHTGTMKYDPAVPAIPAVAVSVPDAQNLARMLTKTDKLVLKLQMNNQLEQAKSQNVIAEITGSERPEEIVLIGAHLDSWDQGTGALDDGAGVGLVMATAALLKQQQRPKRTVRVVLYGNEEGGLLGARAYAEQHQQELAKHVVAAESDFGAGRIWQLQSRFGEKALPFAKSLQQKMAHLGIELGGNDTHGGPDVSVLVPAGVPVIGLMQDGTDYFDYHHTPNDTLDKIDPQALKQNLQAWLLMTDTVANSTVDLRK